MSITGISAPQDSHISVGLDAIPPEQFRELVRDEIERHLPAEQFQVLKAAEASERELIAGLVTSLSERSYDGRVPNEGDLRSPLVRDRDVVVEQTPVRDPHAPIAFRGYLPTFALSPAISVFSPLTKCSSV
jgi:hypothetical protein